MTDHPCGDEVSSLVQAAKDHAATMRKLADVEAQRDAANERLARIEGLVARWNSGAYAGMVDIVSDLRAALADPEGGT